MSTDHSAGQPRNNGAYGFRTNKEPDKPISTSGDQPQGLTVAPGTNPDIAEPMTEFGLQGALEPYTGDNMDVTADAVNYTAPSGTELILDRDPHEGFVTTYDNGDPDYQFRMGGQGPDVPTSAHDVDSIKRALWDVALTGAAENQPLSFSEGDYFEVRETRLDENASGQVVGEFAIQNSDDGYYNHLSYNFDTGEVGLFNDSFKTPLEGYAKDAELDAMLVDMRSEPREGESNEQCVAEIFKSLRGAVSNHADAPAWAKTTTTNESE